MIKVLLGVFCLPLYVIIFLPFSRFSCDINTHLTHNSVSKVVISMEMCNFKRTESYYKVWCLVTRWMPGSHSVSHTLFHFGWISLIEILPYDKTHRNMKTRKHSSLRAISSNIHFLCQGTLMVENKWCQINMWLELHVTSFLPCLSAIIKLWNRVFRMRP
jgi:hypothetical protein